LETGREEKNKYLKADLAPSKRYRRQKKGDLGKGRVNTHQKKARQKNWMAKEKKGRREPCVYQNQIQRT